MQDLGDIINFKCNVPSNQNIIPFSTSAYIYICEDHHFKDSTFTSRLNTSLLRGLEVIPTIFKQ